MSDINIKREYPYSADVLFRALTQKEYLSRWIYKTDDFVLEKGKEFNFYDKPAFGWDGTIQSKVVDFEQNKFLIIDWNNADSELTTVVKFIITESKIGVVLELDHDGYKGFTGGIVKKFQRGGWEKNMDEKLPPILDEISRLKNK